MPVWLEEGVFVRELEELAVAVLDALEVMFEVRVVLGVTLEEALELMLVLGLLLAEDVMLGVRTVVAVWLGLTPRV